MNISSIFRSTPVVKLHSYTSSEVSYAAKRFINKLEGIKSTAAGRGDKALGMYQKTNCYAKKLAKSAEKGNIKDTYKNISKLQKHSDNLFLVTSHPLNRGAIIAAKVELSNIASALLNNKLSLR